MTINSLLLTLVVFLAKKEIVINNLNINLVKLPHWISYIIYFLIIISFSWLSLKMVQFLDTDKIDKNAFSGIEPANDVFFT